MTAFAVNLSDLVSVLAFGFGVLVMVVAVADRFKTRSRKPGEDSK